MSIPEERYVDITRPGETSGGANSGEVRDLKRRLDQHIGAGGQAHAVATETAAGFMPSDDKQKLNGVQNEATKNMPDDYLLARGNHTGVQAIETINGLRQELNELGGAELEELVDRAEGAADRAELARDAATVNAGVANSIADGLAKTSDGTDPADERPRQFQLVVGDEIVLYRHNPGSIAEEVARFPSADAVSKIRERVADFPDSLDQIVVVGEDEKVKLKVDEEGALHVTGIKSLTGDALKGVAEVSEQNIEGIAFAIINAEGYVIYFEPELADGGSSPDPGPSPSAQRFRANNVYEYDHIKDGIYNQWIYPAFVECGGSIFGGAIGSGSSDYYGNVRHGELRSIQVNAGARAQAATIGHVRKPDSVASDDHNGIATLLDLRPDSNYPLMQFQSEHNISQPRQFASVSLDVSGCYEQLTIPINNSSYSQAFRNPYSPDEIILITRSGASSNSTWWFCRSLDNGANWQVSRTIAAETGTFSAYLLAKDSLDGLSLHIAFHEHPISGVSQNILYAQYFWDTGSIEFPNDTGVFISNAWNNPAKDPFLYANAFIAHEGAEAKSTRLFDLLETEQGRIEIVFAEFILSHSVEPPGNKYGDYMHTVVQLGGTTTKQTTLVADCGYPVETPPGSTYYFAGISVAGKNTILAAGWFPPSRALHLQHRGEGRVFSAVLTGGVWDVEIIVTETDVKLLRPVSIPIVYWDEHENRQAVKGGTKYSFIKGRYLNYTDFKTDIFLGEF